MTQSNPFHVLEASIERLGALLELMDFTQENADEAQFAAMRGAYGFLLWMGLQEIEAARRGLEAAVRIDRRRSVA